MFRPVTFLRSSLKSRSYYNPPTTRILDQFTAVDGTDIQGRTPSPTNTPGNTWQTPFGGSYQIISNGATCMTGDIRAMSNNSTFSDCVVSGDIIRGATAWGGQYVGIIFRVQATTDFWTAGFDSGGRWAIAEWHTGYVYTERAGMAFGCATNTTYSIVVTISGNSITATLNGGNTLTYSSSLYAKNTAHGYYQYGAGAAVARLDNFNVTA